MNLTVKTILNRVHPIKGFIYQDVRIRNALSTLLIEVYIRPHRQRKALCGKCHEPAPCYDHSKPRRFEFIPLWAITVVLIYAPRRVYCPVHGVTTEWLPWACGKRHMALVFMLFLAGWARRLSWKETAAVFGTSWQSVCRSVEYVVEWGLAHRDLLGISAIGIDELHWGKGKGSQRFLTLVYQIDAGSRRLLWIGRTRTQRCLVAFFRAMTPDVLASIRFVCSDMWRPFFKAIAKYVPQALHVLDPFHITAQLNKAVDDTRRAEAAEMRRCGGKPVLAKTRWLLLSRWTHVRGGRRETLRDLLRRNLATVRAYILKENFSRFWSYRHPFYVKSFFEYWIQAALRSRIAPIQRIARTLREYKSLVFNWFKARGEISNAVVEGLNNKCRVITRRSYGFRSFRVLELALYHTLGALPEPPITHRFW
jgi:transposase